MPNSRILSKQHFLPCLLDRLIDDQPWERNEPREKRVISVNRYRDSVFRDFRWLFTSFAQMDMVHEQEFPLQARSVTNFGMRTSWGAYLQNRDYRELENRVKQMLLAFEPRLDPASIVITLSLSEGGGSVLNFQISASLWCNPVPQRLLFQAGFDRDSGMFIENTRTTLGDPRMAPQGEQS